MPTIIHVDFRKRCVMTKQHTEPTGSTPLMRVPLKEAAKLVCAGGANGGDIFRAPADGTTRCWCCDAPAVYLTPGVIACTFIGWCAHHAGIDASKKTPSGAR